MAASASMDKIWYFEVTDPSNHPKGFTVYKVTAKVFPVTAPESLTEIVIWKRYNDFKQLYKAMSNLHKSLHRREEFPPFAKPKLFGRFDAAVIEERQASALMLLNFIGQQSHLYKSQIFDKFLEGGKVIEGLSGQVLLPSRLDQLNQSNPPVDSKSILPASNQSTASDNKSPGDGTRSVLKPNGVPGVDQETGNTAIDPGGGNDNQKEQNEPSLEGVWNFPAVPDNISLNSYDEDDNTDVDSALGTPLPESDMSFFDPLAGKTGVTEDEESLQSGTLKTSKSWIMEAVNTCADLEESCEADGLPPLASDLDVVDGLSDTTTDTTLTDTSFSQSGQSSTTLDISEFDPLTSSASFDPLASNVTKSSGDDVGFDPLNSGNFGPSSGGGARIEVGKGDVDIAQLSGRLSSGSVSSQGSSVSPATTPRRKLSARGRALTTESVSTMDLGNKDNYIYLAANQICKAQEYEANGDYELAFTTYKSCVGILLNGVQGDTNKGRREAVRRKTAQYLMKAEDLYNRHLAKESSGEYRWAMDSSLCPSTEVDPSLTFIRGSAGDLKKYKVLGTIDKVILVLDKSTDETFVIKRVYKSTTGNRRRRNILPTSCPYMVNLHKFFETPSTIYLVLQYASGGKLWDYVGAYLRYAQDHAREGGPGAEDGFLGQQFQNVYTGFKVHTDNNKRESFNEAQDKNIKKMDSHPDKNSAISSDTQTLGNDVSYIKDAENVLLNVPVPGDIKDLSVDDFQFDRTMDEIQDYRGGSIDKASERSSPMEIHKDISNNAADESLLGDNNISDETQNKVQYTRFISISSEENADDEDDDRFRSSSTSSQPAPLLRQNSAGAGFQDILQKNTKKTTLENFSINSFDSTEGVVRVDSNVSDQIEAIQEVNEVNIGDGDVFSPSLTSQTAFVNDFQTSKHLDPTSVDRGLRCEEVKIDGVNDISKSRNNSIQNGWNHHESDSAKRNGVNGDNYEMDTSDVATSSCDMKRDIIESSKELLRSVERTLSQVEFPGDVSEKTDSDTLTSQISPQESDSNPTVDEPSIYDLHRDETSDSQSDSKSLGQEDSRPVSTELTTNHSNDSSGAILSKSPKEFLVNNVTTGSAQATTEDQMSFLSEPQGKSRGLSLTIPHANDLSRSAESDMDCRSPSKSRQRTISHMFEQLDISAQSPGQVKIPESFIQKWAAQIIVAVSKLHALGIICRELKPDNILLGDQGNVTLTYFCQLNQVDSTVDFEAVNCMYVAPEVNTIGGHTETCDWWSLGVLLYELLVGKSLLSCHPGGITSHTQLFIPDHLTQEASSLLQQLLVYNARERLGAGLHGVEEIKTHPFFHGIDWNAMETQN